MLKPTIYLVFLFMLGIYQFSFGQTENLIAAQYDTLAEAAFARNQLDSSIYFFQLAQNLYLQDASYEKVLNDNNWISSIYYYKGEFDSLGTSLDWVAPIVSTFSLSIKNNFNESIMLYWSLKGIYYTEMGDFYQAAKSSRKALETFELQENANKENLVSLYQNLAVSYGNIGDYKTAIDYSKRALVLSNGEFLSIDLAIYNSLGYFYDQSDDFKKAAFYYQKEKKLFDKYDSLVKENKDLHVRMLFNLGVCYFKENKKQKDKMAEKLWKEALILLENENQINPHLLPATYRYMGLLQYRRSQNKGGLQKIRLALKLTLERFGHKNVYTANTYKALGDIHDNEAKKALKYYQKALTALCHTFNDSLDFFKNPNLQHPISGKTDLLQILQAKAHTQQQIQASEQALATYQTAIALIDTLRLNYIAEGSKYVLLEKAVPIYEGAIQTALQLGKNKLAFQFAEKSKAVLLLENIKNLQAKSFAHIPEATLEKERDFKIQMAFTERQLFEAQQKDKEDKTKQLQQKLFNLKYDYQAFLQEIERSYPDYYQLKYDTKVTRVEQVQRQLLNTKTALVEYFVGEENIVIFVVTANNIAVYPQKKKTDFEEKIIQLLNTIAQAKEDKLSFENFTVAAWYAYQELVQVFVPELPPNIEQLIIIPDGHLNYIPFQTFIKYQADGQYMESRYDTLSYLVEDFMMSYAYSSTLLLEMDKTKATKKTPISDFGGFAPVFARKGIGQRGGQELTSLVNSLNEVRQIDSIVNGVIFLEEKANKNAFIEKVEDYRILHLATHAAVDDSLSSNGRIHFYDDYLTVGEIYNLPLSAELAVLSACETGTGRLQKGEGLMSLARAFAYSGCPSLVTSLWKVDDEKTSRIMIDFYKNLYHAESKDMALRNAQLSYLDNSLQSYTEKHPFYWAGFVLIGNSDVVFDAVFYGRWIWGLFVLVLGGIVGFIFWFKKRAIS